MMMRMLMPMMAIVWQQPQGTPDHSSGTGISIQLLIITLDNATDWLAGCWIRHFQPANKWRVNHFTQHQQRQQSHGINAPAVVLMIFLPALHRRFEGGSIQVWRLNKFATNHWWFVYDNLPINSHLNHNNNNDKNNNSTNWNTTSGRNDFSERRFLEGFFKDNLKALNVEI